MPWEAIRRRTPPWRAASRAARTCPDIDVVLVGDEAVLTPLLGPDRPANLRLQHASQVVAMSDAPGAAVRQKPDSSIAVATKMVRDRHAQAGHLRRQLRRDDGGRHAHPEGAADRRSSRDRHAHSHARRARCAPRLRRHHRLQAPAPGAVRPHGLPLRDGRARTVSGRASGLLSIGEEPTKGDELTKETHKLLLTSGLNFVGNVEPKEILKGEIDVVVCDGFVGNLMLKAGEGFGELIINLIGDEVKKSLFDSLLAKLLKPALRRVKNRFDYAEVGGALLLGVNGVVVIGHGRSNSLAIANAIRVAMRAAQHHLADSPLPAASDTLSPATS